MSELFREVLRRYMQGDIEWRELLKRTRSRGRDLGIKSEADVERLSDEYRRRSVNDPDRSGGLLIGMCARAQSKLRITIDCE